MDLSISIVNYNTKDRLYHCLKSIYQCKGEVEFEVFVVDNGSKDGSSEMVKQNFPEVHLIQNSENIYFTRAHNQVFKQTKGKYILILNSDTIVKKGTMKSCIDFLNRNPDVAAVTCRMVNPDGSFQRNYSKEYTLTLAFLNYTILGKLFPKLKKQLNEKFIYLNDPSGIEGKEVDVISDASMFIRRDVLEQVGFYDERFKLYYTENDLCKKIKKYNWKICYIPCGEVLHFIRQTVIKEGINKISKIYQEDTIKYYRKYYGYFASFCLSLLIKVTNIILTIKEFKYQNIFFVFLKHPTKKKNL